MEQTRINSKNEFGTIAEIIAAKNNFMEIMLLPDQTIHIDLPLSGYALVPGYFSGKFGLPVEIFLDLYAVKGDEKTAINEPGDLSQFIEGISDQEAVWRFLRLFSSMQTHYFFQKQIYTVDVSVAGQSPYFTDSVIISDEMARRVEYQPPMIEVHEDGYTAARDLISAVSTDRSNPASVFRRQERVTKAGAYTLIADTAKGFIERRDIAFPSYE